MQNDTPGYNGYVLEGLFQMYDLMKHFILHNSECIRVCRYLLGSHLHFALPASSSQFIKPLINCHLNKDFNIRTTMAQNYHLSSLILHLHLHQSLPPPFAFTMAQNYHLSSLTLHPHPTHLPSPIRLKVTYPSKAINFQRDAEFYGYKQT